eukprot:4644825-Prymnesium_polylepis.1
MLRETDGKWDNGYTHARTQVRAALRPRGIVHRKAPRVQPRCSPPAKIEGPPPDLKTESLGS